LDELALDELALDEFALDEFALDELALDGVLFAPLLLFFRVLLLELLELLPFLRLILDPEDSEDPFFFSSQFEVEKKDPILFSHSFLNFNFRTQSLFRSLDF